MIIIPENITAQGDNPQWTGEINNKQVAIYYDDDISGANPVNMYALFSDDGFHGWLELGFTMSEIYMVAGRKPTDYKKAYEEFGE